MKTTYDGRWIADGYLFTCKCGERSCVHEAVARGPIQCHVCGRITPAIEFFNHFLREGADDRSPQP